MNRRTPMSCGYSRAEPAHGTASVVDRILKGAAPAELPVEEPTICELVFNLRTTRQLGLTLSPAWRVRAGKVID